MAETQFCEHSDNDGPVTRRSILKTVNKDDCLVARGANPRTGLITPEANSVADSVDTEIRLHHASKGPSAQWKLEGDQWVSVMTQDHAKDGNLEPPRPAPSQKRQTSTPFSFEETAQSCRLRKASPLTESNLRTHVGQQAGVTPLLNNTMPTNRPLQVGNIRRKPVGSPSNSVSTKRLPDAAAPTASTDTIVRTPMNHDHPFGQAAMAKYFSPEDIRTDLKRSSAEANGKRLYPDTSFLDLPVKSRNALRLQMQGFTDRVLKREQLERSLRMSSGPYPLTHSNRQPDQRPEFDLFDVGVPNHSGAQNPHVGIGGQKPRAAQRAFLPDAAIYCDHPKVQLLPLDSRGSVSSTSLMVTKPTPLSDTVMRDDHRRCNMAEASETQPISNIMCTITNTITSMSSKQASHAQQHYQQDESLPRRDISPLVMGVEYQSNSSRPTLREKHSMRAHRGPSQPAEDSRATNDRPRLGQRSKENPNIHQDDDYRSITTESTVQSKLTGIVGNLWEENAKSETSTDQDASHPPYPIGTGILTDPGHRLLLFEARNFEIPQPQRVPDVTTLDHFACCPECCVRFDCHEGCFGHGRPDASFAPSGTRNLLSMGVFNAGFETSVKAVNDVLMQPQGKGGSRLAKFSATLIGDRQMRSSSPSKTAGKHGAMKRTLQGHPKHQKPCRPVISGPRPMDPKQAVAAALQVMDVKKSSKPNNTHFVAIRALPAITRPTKAAQKPEEKPTVEANEGRRMSDTVVSLPQFDEPLSPPASSSDEADVPQQSASSGVADDYNESVLHRMSLLVRHSSIRFSYTDNHPELFLYVRLVIIRLTEACTIILDTCTILSGMIFEYKQTGAIYLPYGTSPSELLGNCVRTVLYIMVGACLYALIVKVSMIVMVILRIVLLPVRLCAWVIG